MNTGDIVNVSFPFTDLVNAKARPAVVVTQSKDMYKDVIVALISSVLPHSVLQFQMLLQPDHINNLRAPSVVKVSRLVTVEVEKIATVIGGYRKRNSIHLKPCLNRWLISTHGQTLHY